jgi:hypothetical protein
VCRSKINHPWSASSPWVVAKQIFCIISRALCTAVTEKNMTWTLYCDSEENMSMTRTLYLITRYMLLGHGRINTRKI